MNKKTHARKDWTGNKVKTRSGVMRWPKGNEAVRFVGARNYDSSMNLPMEDELTTPSQWLQIVRPTRPDLPGIGIRKNTIGEDYQASFSLRLCTVSSRGIEKSTRSGLVQSNVSYDEVARQGAMNALIGALGPRDSLTILYEVRGISNNETNLKISLNGTTVGHTIDACAERAFTLFHDVCIAMAAGGTEFGFQALPEPIESTPPDFAETVRLIPASVEITAGNLRTAGFGKSQSVARVRLPLPAAAHQSYLTALAPALLAVPYPTEIRIRMTRAAFEPGKLDLIRGAAQQLADGDPRAVVLIGASNSPGSLGPKALATVGQALEPWFAQPDGTRFEIELASDHPVPETLIHLLGAEILQGKPFSIIGIDGDTRAPDTIDLSDIVLRTGLFPPILPTPASLDALGFPRHYPVVRFTMPASGIALGDIPMQLANAEVRITAQDRSQHCYVIGATGTGKSTLMRGMIEQDVGNGDGVALIDPHGDLYDQVLACIPARRRDDVVLVDFTDKDHFVGLNFLERSSRSDDFEKNFIIHELAEIFWRLYGHVPESMGPAFLQYMRNSVALVLEDPRGDLTLLDVPTIFVDSVFRDYLISVCKDESVRDFWLGIAKGTTGDSSLANMGAYVTNKFTEFTQNHLVRLVVGQSKSTINFRQIIDQRKILLVKLSKGLLSETDSRFLGMVVTGRLFAAALSRANVSRARRTPYYVYMDEFQNFTTESVTQALAEARKYGLALTLAHQNLAQLPDHLAESVLANSGSRIFMRVGSPDARKLAQFVSPHFSEHDLVSLPDHHAVARLKVGNVPSPAFVLRTKSHSEGAPRSGDETMRAAIIQKSYAKYCRPAELIKKEIAWRRRRHLLRFLPSALGLSTTLQAFLKERKVKTMADLVGWNSDMVKELMAQDNSFSDRASIVKVLQAISAQAEYGRR